MSMQQRDGGMISQGIGRENIQTIERIVLSQVSIGQPIKLTTTHFVFCAQSFISSRSWLGQLMPWEWKSMAVKNSYWGSHQVLKNVFLIIG